MRVIGVYFETWSCPWTAKAETLQLSLLSPVINTVFLAFALPNCSYVAGSNSFTGTGLQFSSDFSVVKGSIGILHKRGVKVLLSVGGATYPFVKFNPKSIAALVTDLNLDGVDLDFEMIATNENKNLLVKIIEDMKNALNVNSKNSLLSLAAFSVGAYGTGKFIGAPPQGSPYEGLCIPAVTQKGNLLNFINIMGYDASNAYSVTQGFDSYRAIYKGSINVGCEVPPESYGGHVITLSEVDKYCHYIKNDSVNNGLFVWSYYKHGNPTCIQIVNLANNRLSVNPVTSA